ncbi:MAG: asparagine synthase (glutamine-hydrolyzing) [Clostridia bacterium]|nr:asparagine synthase (glutamine-hydrolyzing) [Clostridia bacterium]
MCGICGYADYSEEIKSDAIISHMNSKLKMRGPDSQNLYIDRNIAFGHSRLSIIDVELGHQPMTKYINGSEYTIIYNGELYNTDELRKTLSSKGYDFFSHCDTEVVLTAYAEYKEDCVKKFNGIFAFAIYDKQNNSTFLCRDHLGIKPLFYSLIHKKNSQLFIFASEIKAILANPNISPILDKQGLMELFGLGPAHSPGFTYFKNILEIKAGHYALFTEKGLSIKKYWDLETKLVNDTEEEAISKIHYLVENATKRQLVSDVGICSMLSGGIDSSILTAIAKSQLKNLETFSIDFTGNENNFVSNQYQLTRDSEYVEIMKNFLDTKHTNIFFDNTILYMLLENSLIARDMPGMADIDSSMYAFCRSISDHGFKVCLSGECSDEIFGGYPWFYRDHLVNHDGFPWALSGNIRKNIIKKGVLKDNELSDYVDFRYTDTLKNVKKLDGEELFNSKFRDINYLTVKWFMNTLVERTDRMSMANSLEVRVPYADYRIFEYVYNLPAKMKLGIKDDLGVPIEKYLLRKAFETYLPSKIINRKKSPFPKTYDPNYLKLVESEVLQVINNPKSKISELVDIEYVRELISSEGKNLTENWFGQLMTYPQTLAFLLQIEKWLDIYSINIELH